MSSLAGQSSRRHKSPGGFKVPGLTCESRQQLLTDLAFCESPESSGSRSAIESHAPDQAEESLIAMQRVINRVNLDRG